MRAILRPLTCLIAVAVICVSVAACGSGGAPTARPRPLTAAQRHSIAVARHAAATDIVARSGNLLRLKTSDGDGDVPLADIAGACPSIGEQLQSEFIAVYTGYSADGYVDVLCRP